MPAAAEETPAGVDLSQQWQHGVFYFTGVGFLVQTPLESQLNLSKI